MNKSIPIVSACLLLVAAMLTRPGFRQSSCDFPSDLRTFLPMRRAPTIVADNLRQWVYFEGGQSAVQIGRYTRTDAQSEWVFEEHLFSTDLQLTDVGFAEGGQTLYVAGVRTTASGCEDVVEEWEVVFPVGTPIVEVAGAPPRGIPAPMPFVQTVTTTEVPGPGGGGGFSQKKRPPFTRKTVLFSGVGTGPFSAIEADPEQRFLLLLSYSTGDLYSLDLTSSQSTPVLEFSANEIPHLSLVREISVGEHQDYGRYYRLVETKGDLQFGDDTFLVDADNDGVFETHSTLTGSEFTSSLWSDFDRVTSLVNLTGTKYPE